MPGQATIVTARYATAERARSAVELLSLRGVDGGRIHLDQTGDVTPRRAQRAADARLAGRLGRRAGGGLVTGLLLGAVVGALVAGVILEATVPVLVSGAIAGGVAGVGLGILVGLQSNPTMAPAWGETLREDRGPVTLEVEATPEDAVEIRELLGRTAADTVG